MVTTPTRMMLKNTDLSPGVNLLQINNHVKLNQGIICSQKSLRDMPEFQEHNPEKTSKYSGNVLLTHPGSLIVTEASPHAASEKAMAIR